MASRRRRRPRRPWSPTDYGAGSITPETAQVSSSVPPGGGRGDAAPGSGVDGRPGGPCPLSPKAQDLSAGDCHSLVGRRLPQLKTLAVVSAAAPPAAAGPD